MTAHRPPPQACPRRRPPRRSASATPSSSLGGAGFIGLSAQVAVPLSGSPRSPSRSAPRRAAHRRRPRLRRGAAELGALPRGRHGRRALVRRAAPGWQFASFGYIVGFVAAAALVGWLAQRGGDRTVATHRGHHGAGQPGRSTRRRAVADGLRPPAGLGTALALGFVPFLVGDAIKIAVAAGLLPASWKLVQARRVPLTRTRSTASTAPTAAHPAYPAVARRKDPSAGTPATSALTRAGVAFGLHPYEHDPAAASYGLEAAAALRCPGCQVFKTLLVEGERGLAVGIVPVDRQLDLKAVAAALGLKKVTMADPPDAERATGYVVGGISPIGQKRALPTVLDESALALRPRLRLRRPPRPGRLARPRRPRGAHARRDCQDRPLRLTPRGWRAPRSCGSRRWPRRGPGRAGPRGRRACAPAP